MKWAPVKDAATYRLYWRRADRNDWSDGRVVLSDAPTEVVSGAIVDDNFFGVSALSVDDRESIVTLGGLPPAQ
ncbi:hypothetical protein ATE68_23570 [Sphingopyxis sp. H038]|uniref:hypothetical protein n=1 Tax=unclassified Sphingopyxis TaxID=2614943 RepID=UPI000731097D|nr:MULTISPECIES: hypothetical protein [unclassified Sphingopyxis]KTE00299.1 hypothetical protein ATE78_19090 [Sphingopyxis sp. H012]KTE06466.1 hypothetical protein ATE70_22505 [Sphingopyxis sp. H053]KTE07287.1 hypothetical protein ATE76_17875 [Sphingopyxis sp. H093]KTE28838.1 hypothetical protein ATE75_10245 [Sphingopyxis sp. H080]KTE29331.1 hypothetical protein ATE68_23570 [Sphingopyxis sp. H038]